MVQQANIPSQRAQQDTQSVVFCSNCGSKNHVEDAFCPVCGTMSG